MGTYNTKPGTYSNTPYYGVGAGGTPGGLQLDVAALNDMSKKAGIAPVAPPPTAMAPSPVGVGNNIAPLSNNPVAANKKSDGGFQMDWGAFASKMAEAAIRPSGRVRKSGMQLQ